jgi:O-antigen ligase
VFGVLALSVTGVDDGAPEGAGASVTEQVSSASGRSEVWSAYAQIWRESPWWGSPDERIGLAALTGQLPGWASTAHNLLLDSLVRLGLLGTTLVVVAFVVVGLLAVRAAAHGVREGIGLTAVVLGCSLTEALVYWRLLSISTIILFLAVIASVGPYPPARWPRRGSSRPEATISAAD